MTLCHCDCAASTLPRLTNKEDARRYIFLTLLKREPYHSPIFLFFGVNHQVSLCSNCFTCALNHYKNAPNDTVKEIWQKSLKYGLITIGVGFVLMLCTMLGIYLQGSVDLVWESFGTLDLIMFCIFQVYTHRKSFRWAKKEKMSSRRLLNLRYLFLDREIPPRLDTIDGPLYDSTISMINRSRDTSLKMSDAVK